jgi:predicted amidophosphoribosyltransferase
MMSMLSTLYDLLLPLSCVGCSRHRTAWCAECRAELEKLRQVCRATLPAGPPLYALGDYGGAARRAVLAYKERRIHALAAPLAAALVEVLPWLPPARAGPDGTWWLVPAPSRRSAARRRGGDHMLRLARECARLLATRGQPAAVAPALRLSRRAVDSVGLDVVARLRNLSGRIYLRPEALPPPGVPVVLLDDVVTTGATAAACVRTLSHAGTPVSAVLTLTAVR